MRSRKIPTLSKSKYLAGLQCPLRLWHQCYNPDLASEISPAQQALFDTGHEVGALATRLYAGGVYVETDPLRHKEAVEATLRAMEDPGVPAIYEASFLYDNVRIKVDILARLEHDKWNLIEVKSSTRVKDQYLPDVAVQYHVLKGAGLEYLRMIDPSTPPEEKEKIRKDLLTYCERDTLAMVKTREKLLKRCG